MLRSFVITLLDAGKDLKLVAGPAGHRSVETTAIGVKKGSAKRRKLRCTYPIAVRQLNLLKPIDSFLRFMPVGVIPISGRSPMNSNRWKELFTIRSRAIIFIYSDGDAFDRYAIVAKSRFQFQSATVLRKVGNRLVYRGHFFNI